MTVILIATQGALYSVGFTIMCFPIISMRNEWFVATEGSALGIMQASTGVSEVAGPLAWATLLITYCYALTLGTFAVAS